MANYVLADGDRLNSAIKATANAIREKTGSTDSVPWDMDTGFASTIASMEVGVGTEWEPLMPATDVTFTNGGEYITFENVYPLSLGKSYKVVWGEEKYVCESVEATFQGMPCIAIGNTGALEGNPGTEPFVIGYIPSANGFGIIRIDGVDGTLNVSIYKEKELIPEGAHVITFVLEDGTTYTKPVMHGDTCGDPVSLGLFSTPVKESTAQYEYTHNGWSLTAGGNADSNALVNITEDRTVYAAFAGEVRYYTINFYDGETLLQTMVCEYGVTPEYTPANKTGYKFAGWEPSIVSVICDTDYHAIWLESLSGVCGDNATWNISDDGVLTISGEGNMYDYATMESIGEIAPWRAYTNSFNSVVVEEGITNIGSSAFQQCSNIVSVILPNGITTIGNRAFVLCTGITSINLPESVTKLSTSCFMSCSNLTTINIHDNLTDISEDNIFYYCTKLNTIRIPINATFIGPGMFHGCSGASNASVTISDKVTVIGSSAFHGVPLTSAVFESTNDWTRYSTKSNFNNKTGGSLLSYSNNLKDAAKAATALTSTYSTYWWERRGS